LQRLGSGSVQARLRGGGRKPVKAVQYEIAFVGLVSTKKKLGEAEAAVSSKVPTDEVT
jgi:hypothetical protein